MFLSRRRNDVRISDWLVSISTDSSLHFGTQGARDDPLLVPRCSSELFLLNSTIVLSDDNICSSYDLFVVLYSINGLARGRRCLLWSLLLHLFIAQLNFRTRQACYSFRRLALGLPQVRYSMFNDDLPGGG